MRRRTSTPSYRTHHFRLPDWSEANRGGANVAPNGGPVRFAPPDDLPGEELGEELGERIENYRRYLREMFGLDMSRD